jgi:hypothetical protein
LAGRATVKAFTRAEMPSIRSWLFFFDGLRFSLESCSTVTLAAHQRNPAGWRANFYPTGLNDSVLASAYEPSVPL